MNRLNICFVAHFALRSLTGRGHGHIGGVERQTALMAKWLTAQGHSVSVIVWGDGKEDEKTADGIRIIKTCAQSSGIPGLRFFIPRWSSLVRAMKRANAEIYYHNCAEYVTGQVGQWAVNHERKFVYSVASDPDCDPNLPTLETFREKSLYRRGLYLADAVIVQTKTQKEMLQEGFGIGARVLPMPCEAPVASGRDEDQVSKGPPRVLWIGRLSPEKRAHAVVELARNCPQFEFDVVGPDGTDTEYVDTLRKRCVGLRNINLVGAVNYTDVAIYYRQASVLCCTSEFEGFPNTFLEAWSQGLPVVSTVDPGGTISRHDLGRVADGLASLCERLTDLLQNDQARDAIAENAIAYFGSYHAKDVAMVGFEDLLVEVAENRRSANA